MRVIPAFLRLVRLPNLFFIALTQFLFYYCIVLRFKTPPVDSVFPIQGFYLLVIASVLIAAAGYIINDYFDINIDQVNKPGRQVVEKIIKRRWAMVWHIVLSLTGVGICFYVDYHYPGHWMTVFNFICVLLLFGYSVTLKKKLLIGNVLISALTAWVIIVIYLCYLYRFYPTTPGTELDPNINIRFTRLALLYAGFAFIISLIREIMSVRSQRRSPRTASASLVPRLARAMSTAARTPAAGSIRMNSWTSSV